MSSFYRQEEVIQLGFKSIGENVLISKKACFYNIQHISIGSNVRIDDFCILSGHISLGSYIHIGAFSALYGSKGIEMEDYTGLSPRCSIFSASDDFSGDYLISPMVNDEKTNVTGGPVKIRKYTQIGAGCTIMPCLEIKEGVAVGAMSLVRENIEAWGIYAGIPAKKIKDRKNGLLQLV